MATEPPATHLELLDAARGVQRSAASGDVDGLHGEVCRELQARLLRQVALEPATDRPATDMSIAGFSTIQ